MMTQMRGVGDLLRPSFEGRSFRWLRVCLVLLLVGSMLLEPCHARMRRRRSEAPTLEERKRDVEESQGENEVNALPIQPGANGANHLITENPPYWNSDKDYTAKHYAGYISVNTSTQATANMFYWFFESLTSPSADPLVVWLNGGPGCSSFDGLFLEKISPFHVTNTCVIEYNPFSWNNRANIIFLDQPVGTGFSYGASIKKDDFQSIDGINAGIEDAAFTFRNFLLQFMEYYPSYKHRDLYIFGESYAGQYIPYYSNYFKIRYPEPSLNLVGIGIGNGWVEPYSHYITYADFGLGNGLLLPGQKRALDAKRDLCKSEINAVLQGSIRYATACDNLLDDIESSSGFSGSFVNVYDIRLYGSSISYPDPNLNCLNYYLNRTPLKSYIHASTFPNTWKECTNNVDQGFARRDVVSTLPEILALMKANVRVLLYSGQFDLICNHIGTTAFLDSVTPEQWSPITGFRETKPAGWAVKYDQYNAKIGRNYTQKDVAGWAQSYDNLTFLLFLGGGHMCPMDQPRNGQDMINRFLTQTSFNDFQETIFPTDEDSLACDRVKPTTTPSSTPKPRKSSSPSTPVSPTPPGTDNNITPFHLIITGVLCFLIGAILTLGLVALRNYINNKYFYGELQPTASSLHEHCEDQ